MAVRALFLCEFKKYPDASLPCPAISQGTPSRVTPYTLQSFKPCLFLYVILLVHLLVKYSVSVGEQYLSKVVAWMHFVSTYLVIDVHIQVAECLVMYMNVMQSSTACCYLLDFQVQKRKLHSTALWFELIL